MFKETSFWGTSVEKHCESNKTSRNVFNLLIRVFGVEILPLLEPRVETGEEESVHADGDDDNDDENDDHLDRPSLPGFVFAGAARTKLSSLQYIGLESYVL